ncbi:MAG: DegV family protein [Ruminococcaceae bacterium]|nr:DegV family protein [Oscillospiraceae bacterium]
MSYVILTDSSANLTDELIEQCGVAIISFTFHVGDKELKSYVKGQATDLKQFYSMMRNKEHITTSLVSPEAFTEFFEPFLKEGQDILYLGFSSGLSGTYQSSTIAADSLKEKYPERKIITVDSLCACLGQGLLVYHATELKAEGKSIEEVAQWLTDNRLRMCHWFTCDDLFFLKRGGRISSTSAVFGSLLQVKPVMHMDDDGKLAVVEKARGRKQSLQALVKHMEETVENPEEQMIYIAHGDCEEDAEYVRRLILEKFSVKGTLMNCIDPVVGAHSGPGTLAIFYLGKNRY